MSNQKITELRLMTAQHAADLLALADEYERDDHERALELTTSANSLLLGEMIVGLLAVIASNLQQINNPLRQPAAVDS